MEIRGIKQIIVALIIVVGILLGVARAIYVEWGCETLFLVVITTVLVLVIMADPIVIVPVLGLSVALGALAGIILTVTGEVSFFWALGFLGVVAGVLGVISVYSWNKRRRGWIWIPGHKFPDKAGYWYHPGD